LEAKKALLKLNDLVRMRGLNLQSGKTRIIKATEARLEIDGVAPQIRSITAQIAKELRELGGSTRNSGTLQDIERFLERNPESPPPEILERAFTDNFLAQSEGFDKTLFHYLLTRLGRVKSNHAVDYCIKQIPLRPDETKSILKYLAELHSDENTHNALLEFMESDDAVYDYQLFEIMRWFYGAEEYPERLLRLSRLWAFDKNRYSCLRTYCLAILGDRAGSDDFDFIEGKYSQAQSIVEKTEIIVSLAKMETGRRNAIMGRYKDDGFLIQKAIEYVKTRKG
jgi:hypothetical protein